MDYNYISTKKCRSNFLRRPQHGGRRSLAGLESVTLRPFPLTSALDTTPPFGENFAKGFVFPPWLVLHVLHFIGDFFYKQPR